MSEHKFLLHDKKDSVGVAIRDIQKDETVKGTFLDSDEFISINATEFIPLGHKIALKSIKTNEFIIEYGEKIGKAYKDIKPGDWVHVHNLKGDRWLKKTLIKF